MMGVLGHCCAKSRPDLPKWMGPVGHARVLLRRAEQLGQQARNVLHVSFRVGLANPLRANHHFVKAGSWLVHGGRQLQRVGDDLMAAMDAVAADSNVDLAAAMTAMFAIARQCAILNARLVEIACQLDARSKEILEAAEHMHDRKPRPTAPAHPAVSRAFLLHRTTLTLERSEVLFKRRRRFRPAVPEDAPRRVSRGRAPPLLSAASL